MARSTKEILDDIVAEKEKNTQLKDKLTNDASTSLWRGIYYTFATAIRGLELIQDKFKLELQKLIDNQIVGTLPWYVSQAKKFQKGFTLKIDGTYDNTGKTEKEISDSKIVKFAAATESDTREIVVKVYGETSKLVSAEVSNVQSYMDTIKFAGTSVLVTSNDADVLELNLTIYRTSPYTISEEGASNIDGTDVITNTINSYLNQLPYNGRLTVQELSNSLEKLASIDLVQANNVYVRAATSASSSKVDLLKEDKQEYIPVSGFFTYDKANSNITIK